MRTLLLVAWLALSITTAGAGQSFIVVDGDTVRQGGVTYRLLGFDAPETYYARCARERALGDAATLRLTWALISSLRSEIRPIGVRDKYHRELARLMIDGRDIAEAMISEGYARSYRGGRRRGWCGPD